jgi:hypothetical protein
MIRETEPDWLCRWGGRPRRGAGTPLPGPFRLPFVSRVFSYLLDYRKVMCGPIVSL